MFACEVRRVSRKGAKAQRIAIGRRERISLCALAPVRENLNRKMGTPARLFGAAKTQTGKSAHLTDRGISSLCDAGRSGGNCPKGSKTSKKSRVFFEREVRKVFAQRRQGVKSCNRSQRTYFTLRLCVRNLFQCAREANQLREQRGQRVRENLNRKMGTPARLFGESKAETGKSAHLTDPGISSLRDAG